MLSWSRTMRGNLVAAEVVPPGARGDVAHLLRGVCHVSVQRLVSADVFELHIRESAIHTGYSSWASRGMGAGMDWISRAQSMKCVAPPQSWMQQPKLCPASVYSLPMSSSASSIASATQATTCVRMSPSSCAL